MTSKRNFSDSMETKEEDNSQTSKKQKIDAEGDLLKVTNTESKKRQMKVKGPTFEIKEYAFSKTLEESIDKFKTRAELFDKYRDDKETSMDESLKWYDKVRKISNKDVSLVTIRDHTQNTLNLAVATKNKVEEMRMNLENIPVLDLIHLHK